MNPCDFLIKMNEVEPMSRDSYLCLLCYDKHDLCYAQQLLIGALCVTHNAPVCSPCAVYALLPPEVLPSLYGSSVAQTGGNLHALQPAGGGLQMAAA